MLVRRAFTQALITATVICAVPQIASAASLISYWNFDEPSGNTVIDSGVGNDGTLGAGVTRVPGILGSGALSFNNTSSAFVNVGSGVGNSFSVTDGISITSLIQSNWTGGFKDYDEIFRKEDGDNRILLSFQNDDGYRGIANETVLSFGLNVGGVYDEMDTPLDDILNLAGINLLDGKAYHVAATYDSATRWQSLYINGILVNSLLRTQGDGKVRSGGGANAAIGNISPSGGEPFKGTIDELAIYNGAISEDEISRQVACFKSGQSYDTCTLASIPEPSSVLGILGLAAVGVGGLLKRRQK